ncbi:hypothetical protein E4Q08_12565 [Candidatus Accumulibacter phosphatis]|uniref:AbiEi antitoxin N-terminal domain-containing protein n=1 Tax=Candidatus Accumulibacter contiguus TaxID=2954381 RepID=A0ABX1TAA0_9PROT|nr:hypothetical protein [Candidatus Accumulibacter contiguus]
MHCGRASSSPGTSSRQASRNRRGCLLAVFLQGLEFVLQVFDVVVGSSYFGDNGLDFRWLNCFVEGERAELGEPAAELAGQRAPVGSLDRPCDLAPLGIPRVSLTRAVRRGLLERIGHGLYGLPRRDVSAHGSLAGRAATGGRGRLLVRLVCI